MTPMDSPSISFGSRGRTSWPIVPSESSAGRSTFVPYDVKFWLRVLFHELVEGPRRNDGRQLEALMEAVFLTEPQFGKIEARIKTGDEELDLIVYPENPYFLGIPSPMIFVECKDSADKASAQDFRGFAMKLQNHQPLARFGLLVSAKGFTKQVKEARKRASGSEYVISLVELSDVKRFVESDLTLAEWLKDLFRRL